MNYPILIPRPQNISLRSDCFPLTSATGLFADEANRANARYLRERLLVATGYPLLIDAEDGHPGIYLQLRDDLSDLEEEGYTLEVTADTAKIEALTPRGIFYGVQTLLQLLPPESESPGSLSGNPILIPGLEISDEPRFPWRGFMLDEGRHFHGKETVKLLLEVMARLKMNIFHWHLTEDQGWRVEIPGYPCLTEIGAWRAGTAQSLLGQGRRHDGRPHGGFYTREEIREVVAYAAERHITVVPEIEMPGHSLAALAAYPEFSCTGGPFEVATRFGIFKDVYCPGKEATFKFLFDVLNEVMNLFPGPYIHIGGDEAPKARWKTCPDCQRCLAQERLADEHELQIYFTNRIASYLTENGRTPIGWNEALNSDLHPQAVIQYWVRNRNQVVAAIRNGRKTIISSYLDYYLDHSYSLTPLSRIYQFEPVFAELSETEAENILGVEAPLWTEFVPNRARLDFQVFPRLLAVAETGWTTREQKDWVDFRLRLTDFLPRLDALGLRYARSREVEPPWFKRIFGLLTIAQPQRRTIE
jgi:hexosaminidase